MFGYWEHICNFQDKLRKQRETGAMKRSSSHGRVSTGVLGDLLQCQKPPKPEPGFGGH